MLTRASVQQVKSGAVCRSQGHLVVAMRLYPRFLPRDRIDEYVQALSPPGALFARYRELKKKSGDQDDAFQRAGYEGEFRLSPTGMSELSRLAAMSVERDVYLVCQCAPEEQCHVDLMLLIAESEFGARIGGLAHGYPQFRERLRSGLG